MRQWWAIYRGNELVGVHYEWVRAVKGAIELGVYTGVKYRVKRIFDSV